MAKATDKAKALEVFEKCDTGKKGYLTYDKIEFQRMMFPPELIILHAAAGPAGAVKRLIIGGGGTGVPAGL